MDNLHRHPDYAPVKKEPVEDKKVSEDNDLPPRPTEVHTNNADAASPAFDGDGEFGSKLFPICGIGLMLKYWQVIFSTTQTSLCATLMKWF